MNTNSINTISKYLLLLLLILTGASCNDNDDAEDTSIPVLISQNINDGDVVGPSGYVELTFSKAMRQAPDTEIYFNGGVVRVSINYEKVRYTFSGMENKECTFEVPAGALTDMQGRAYDEDFFLSFTAKSEISGGGKVFDAIVDSKGNGDYTTLQAAINAITTPPTSPYKIFIANGTYNECVRINKNKPFVHLIGESRDGVKIQFAVNRVDDSSNATSWPYSIFNENSPARKAGYSEEQNTVVLIEATDFYAENISIINLYGAFSNRHTGGLGKNGQAEALINREDRFALNNTKLKMDIIDSHWGYGGQVPTLYAEYNTIDKNGNMIAESKTITSGNVSFTSSVLTASEAAKYTYENIITIDSWNPKEYMETPLAAPTNVNLSGNTLTWDAVSGAAGYLIFMNGNYAGQTTDTTVTLTNTDESNIYTVKTVSQYGTVSE